MATTTASRTSATAKAKARAKARAKAKARSARPAGSLIILYLVFAIMFAPVAFYTVLHLVFFGFTGEPVGIDLGIALVLPLAWAIGLLRTVKLRGSNVSALIWGYSVIGLLVIGLIVDTVRFQPIFAG